MNKHNYYIIEASFLPEVFLKVVEAENILKSGKAKTINEAVNQVGISRSAFYKYREGIRPFYEMTTDKIVTFHITTSDEAGILSKILNIFASVKANILTINQNIPINGRADITISARMGEIENILEKAQEIDGIIKFEILSSEQNQKFL